MLTPSSSMAEPEMAAAALSDALAALGREPGGKHRDAVLATFRRHLARIQQQVQDAFERDQLDGLQAAFMLATLTDGLIVALFEHATSGTERGPEDRLALAATGGYGRGVLA